MKVHCDWWFRVASVVHSFALVYLPVFVTFAATFRSTCHLRSAGLTYNVSLSHCSSAPVVSRVALRSAALVFFSVSAVYDDSFICVSSVVTAISGRKRAIAACSPLRLFRGLCSPLLN